MGVSLRQQTRVGGSVVQHGDARRPSTYRAVLGDETVALLHADPPYCLLERRNKKGQLRDPKGAKLDHPAVRRFASVAEYRTFTERWLLPALDRVAPGGHAVIWTNLLGREPIAAVATGAGFHPHGTFLWAKLGKGGNSGEKLARLYEVALIFGRAPLAPLAPEAESPPRHFISGYDVEGEADTWDSHPNHKPHSLLAPLLRHYTRPGERVLEPFSGSGSTLAAAVTLGRHCSAIELRQHWAELSGRRLAHVAAQVGAADPAPTG